MKFREGGRGKHLLRKSKNRLHQAVFSRFGLILLLFLCQLFLMIFLFRAAAEFIPHVFGGTVLFSAVMVVVLLNDKGDPTAKLTWLIFFTIAPIFGALFYVYTKSDFGHRLLKERSTQLIREGRSELRAHNDAQLHLQQRDPRVAGLAKYISNSGCYPVWENTAVTYFPIGEDKFAALLTELKKAKHFIFLEYFIIEEGEMWGQIRDILVEKVQSGVEVRVLVDGTCEFSHLTHRFPEQMRQLGIKCKMFAPVRPFISTHYNYRDHRKIAVIDGNVAFTGGVNLSDEYINRVERFGHWKDTAIMLRGQAARSFTLMFLNMWAIDEHVMDSARFLAYPTKPVKDAPGFVLPYSDCPLDGNKVGERVYMDILYRAKSYVHIMTPYLIIDHNMETALQYAAERGVDVHLILPGIPDKKYAFALAHTHYASLLAAGVKISEYTPGFVHAKVFVADDVEAVVGTINLDYRSLYHHFECAAYMLDVPCIKDIENDFQRTLRQCRRMTTEKLKNDKFSMKLTGALLKAIAPLM